MPEGLSEQLARLLSHVAPLSRAQRQAHGVFGGKGEEVRIEVGAGKVIALPPSRHYVEMRSSLFPNFEPQAKCRHCIRSVLVGAELHLSQGETESGVES